MAATKQEVDTYWQFDVYKLAGGAGPDDRERCLVSGGSKPDLGATLADLVSALAYYAGLGYKVEARGLQRVCRACYGAGTVNKRLSRLRTVERKCRACKGVGVFERVGPVRPEWYRGTKITTE